MNTVTPRTAPTLARHSIQLSQKPHIPSDSEEQKDMSLDVRAKRIYDQPEQEDGYRVLIDHVWPRGISRERARLDAWARELAPSDALRNWFDHRPPRFAEFRARYRDELVAQSELLDALRRRAASGRVTVLYAARDREHNNAVVLVELLRDA